MARYFFYYVTLVLYLVLQFSVISCAIISTGFSTKLINRDSPESPFYDPSLSWKERSKIAIRRSISRLSHFKPAHNLETNLININASVFRADGEYVMEFYVGTPPFKQLAIADTGSDITWTQCLPCNVCFKQNQPMFNSEKSSTFRKLNCGSSLCGELELNKACHNANAACDYRLSYGDQSSSSGVLAMETYTIGGTSIPELGYGCSHSNGGTFQPDTSGIVGLGGGPLSLVNQLRRTIPGKFSYCLVSDNAKVAKSTINFGSNANVIGSNVVSTPLVKGEFDTYYYLTLEGMSVGKSRFHYNGTTRLGQACPVKKGNIIIDSGTTITFLPFTLSNNLVESMKSAIKAEPVPDPDGYFNLCYRKTKTFTAPMITAHFDGGADLKLPWTSTFYEADKDLVCLGFMATENLNIYGNTLQRDYLIGYDLENRKLSFKPTDCSKE